MGPWMTQAAAQSAYSTRQHTEDCLDANDDTSVLRGRCICPPRPQMVNGVRVDHARIYREGDYYRWQIVDIFGREYVDGGNYPTRQAAVKGLADALDPEVSQ